MTVNPDLAKERLNCPFSQEELTNLIDGGPQKTFERRRFQKLFFENPKFSDDTNDFIVDSLSSKERYEFDIKRSIDMALLAKETADYESARAMLGAGIGSALLPDGNALGLHYVMFTPTLMGQADMDQQSKWLGRAWSLEIIGTYAQTELGHGTFIRGLETTSTYDPKTQEFVLNTPTLTAHKWWPGGLGKTANYAIVMAELITNGEKKGPHPFFVQIRDEETHEPLPGITVGETGPKLGMNSNDNGFLGFDHHRIPRENMLMKNSKVLPDGTYVKPAQEKLSYGTMVFVRVAVCTDTCAHLRKAVTIAVRYSAVRRQSELYPGEPEPQIIEYQTQQHKLFPPLAFALGFHFASFALWEAYQVINEEIQIHQNFDNLPELHSLTCGLKALITQDSADAIDVLRRSCGGHGFMSSSNLPRLWGLVTAACTYEGENTVLCLQLARYLVKSVRQIKEGGGNIPDSVQYLANDFKMCNQQKFDSASGSQVVRKFQQVSKGLLQSALKSLDDKLACGLRAEDAWNQTSIEFAYCSMSHMRAFVIEQFAKTLQKPSISVELKSVLSLLFEIMALTWINKFGGDFVRFGGFQEKDFVEMNSKLGFLYAKVRPIAVSIVDAFDIPDRAILSTLGSYDGNVYERMFAVAKKSPLNDKDVQDAYHKYIKPALKANL